MIAPSFQPPTTYDATPEAYPALAFAEGKLIGEALLEVKAVVVIVGRVIMALIEPEQHACVVAGLIAKTLAPGE